VNALPTLALVAGTLALVLATLEHRSRSRMPLWSLLRDRLRPVAVACVGCVVVAGVALVLLPLLACLRSGSCTLAPTGAFGASWMAWAAVAVAPKLALVFSEEVIFRGSLLPLLARHVGGTAAVAVSALAFAAAHRGRSMFDLGVLLLDGTGFGLAYLLTGSLWVPIAWHGAKNLAVWIATSQDTLRVVPGLWELRAAGTTALPGVPPSAGWLDVTATAAVVAATIAVLAFRCRQARESSGLKPQCP
jgi:membrane protease YdiL (CAAX protease family)